MATSARYERKHATSGGDPISEIKSLLNDQGRLWAEFKAANDARLKAVETKNFAPPDLVEKVEKLNAELGRLDSELAEIAKKAGRIGAGAHDEGRDVREHKAAWTGYVRTGETSELRQREQKALRTASDPDGGYLVPESVEANIERVAAAESAMRRLARVITIGTSSYRKIINKGGAGIGGWAGESDSPSESSAPKLGELSFATGTLWAEPHATKELLEDGQIDVETWLAEEVGITFAEQESIAFIAGDGVKKPRGLLDYSAVANASYEWGKLGYVKTGGAAGFAATNPADALVDVVHALNRTYRNNAMWLMNDLTLSAIRKLKDAAGNYLWQPVFESGVPGTILGYRYEVDDNMPDLGANDLPIAFGDFGRGYLIVDRRGVAVLRDEYTRKPYVKFYTTRRVGGGVQNFEAIKLIKCAA